MYGISMRDHRLLLLTQPESLHTMSYYSLPDCFCQKHYTHEQQAVEMRAPIKKKQTDALLIFNSSSILGGVPLFLALQSNEPEGYSSPRHLTCPAVCSVTDKPSGFALSLVPADGTVVLMGHTGVLETRQRRAREVLQSVSTRNTIWTVKCQRKM